MLLDTHVLLWTLGDDPQLGRRTRAEIAAASVVHFSAASTWELAIKQMLGRIDFPDRLLSLLTDSGLTELPVTSAHTLAIRGFVELGHHDPFDRLLVAQAAHEHLQLITADRRLLATGLSFIADSRL